MKQDYHGFLRGGRFCPPCGFQVDPDVVGIRVKLFELFESIELFELLEFWKLSELLELLKLFE